MRVTNNMMITNMTRNLQNNIRRLDQTQLRYSTGKEIHRPSDDPVGITKSLKIRADISELEQFKKNTEDALSWVESTEQAVIGYTDALAKIRDLTVQASNGVLTEEETQKIKSEVSQLKEQIISQANTSYSGNFLFSGKNTDKKFLNEDGTYSGEIDPSQLDPATKDNHTIEYQVGIGERININTLGLDLFEVDDVAKNGGDTPGIIALVEEIEDLLEDGTEGLTEKLDDIDGFMDKALTIRGDIGARVNRLELIVNRAEDDTINLRDRQSKLEDADLAETAIQLMNEENVYRSSLSVGARIIQPTLLDFLR